MNSGIALDTNVLIYLHDNSNPAKREIAKNLLADDNRISSQVVSEYLNTTRRLLNLTKEQLLEQTSALFARCTILHVTPDTLYYAATLVKKYQFQLFDAVIIASAIEGNCSVLYSEDMQHGLVVEKTLTIINPFI